MQFIFPAVIQAGIQSGQYEVVRNAAGQALGLARDSATGQFAGHAVSLIGNSGAANPIFAPMQIAMNAGQMYQTSQGFQAVQTGLQTIQASLGVLQTMTALTGVGVAANLAVSAVSLWQILKLREDVKLQRVEMREGFVDLKQALKNQGTETIQKINEAVQDIEFRQHRQTLIQAYGRFLEATRFINLAMRCDDLSIRNADLSNARQSLGDALADYGNPLFLPEASSVTQLRRSECVWAIKQSIAITYQLQNQPDALSNCLEELQRRICQDLLEVIKRCDSEDELEIIFPEITRIYEQDFAVVKAWQNQVDWLRSLSPSEQAILQNISVNQPEIIETTATVDIAIPPEQLLYENLEQKSHFSALRDALRLMIQTQTRQEYEAYISQRAKFAGHKMLVIENLRQMSNLSIANLYWYFQIRDDSEQEMTLCIS